MFGYWTMEIPIYILLAVVVLTFLLKSKKLKGKQIPGPSGWPVIGNALEITGQNMPQKCFEYAKQYGSIVRLKLFNTHIILLNSVEMLQKAVNGDIYKHYFNDRPGLFYGEHFQFGSQGVGTYKNGLNSTHSVLRKTVAKGLHLYGEGRKEFEELVVTELGNVINEIEMTGGKEFELMNLLKKSLSNLLSILLIGEALDENDEDSDLFWEFAGSTVFMYNAKADTVYSTFPFVRYLPGLYKDQYENVVKTRHRLIERYYTKVKETHKPGATRGLMDVLLSERNKELKTGKEHVFLTEERLIGTLLDITVGALLTSISSLSCTILCLMKHPECQEKIQKEIDVVIGRDRLPMIEDRVNCQYLEAVTMEVQRFITITPLGGPHICKPNMQFEGFNIPANSMVFPNLNFIHHDKEIWGPDAWEFRPERFLDDNGDIIPRNHVYRKNWVPFGLGRRKCPGDTFARTRIFLYAATLFQRWTFIPSPGKCGSCDPRSGDFVVNLGVRPKDVYCRVEKRI